jgi:hypothetical protein
VPVHPAIAALRGNPSLQHAAQARLEAALSDWRLEFGLTALESELGEFAEGAMLGNGLAALFGADDAQGRALVGGLVRSVSAALAEQPLGHLSLRHALDESAATLVLARSGAVALSLQVLGGVVLAERPLATIAVFQPAQSVARVLRGSGQARLVRTRATEGPLEVAPLALEMGLVLHCDGQREAMLIDKIDRPLLLLKLQRRSIAAAPARELDIASGAQLRQAASSPRDSRLELATALLGRMGRADAVPMLAAIALEPGSPQLRWHALRECLALDSAAGSAALSKIADQPADPLTAPAMALRAQLRSTHPELGAVPCLV